MKTRDIIKKLTKAGWKFKRDGGKHDIYEHPDFDYTIPVPRHREVKEYTGEEILKRAGLK